MEPHTSSPSPCKYEVKLNQVKAIGSFTSFQVFYTHASLPRGFFQIHPQWKLLSVPWSGNGFKIEGRIIECINPKTHRLSSGNASIRRAWMDKVLVDSAKWLARWAKSAAEKIWTGCRERSPSGSSRRSSMAMLASLSLLRMFQKNVASWWIWTGGGLMSALAMKELVSSMTDSCADSGLSGPSAWWGRQFPYEEVSGIWK